MPRRQGKPRSIRLAYRHVLHACTCVTASCLSVFDGRGAAGSARSHTHRLGAASAHARRKKKKKKKKKIYLKNKIKLSAACRLLFLSDALRSVWWYLPARSLCGPNKLLANTIGPRRPFALVERTAAPHRRPHGDGSDGVMHIESLAPGDSTTTTRQTRHDRRL